METLLPTWCSLDHSGRAPAAHSVAGAEYDEPTLRPRRIHTGLLCGSQLNDPPVS